MVQIGKNKKQKTSDAEIANLEKQLENSTKALTDIAAEAWRFERAFTKMLGKMEIQDAERFSGQYKWFRRKVQEAMAGAELVSHDLTGLRYDVGMAVQAMNLDDFDTDEELYIVQMIEPVILCHGRVMRTGIVMLGRIEE